DGNQFTYGELYAFARKLAAKLSRLGVGCNDFVTIELPRNKEYIAAITAVWMTGAAAVPLSLGYPAERLQYIRADCRAKAVIDVDSLNGIENEALLAELAEVKPTDPALLIYTSGSTGKPKGVLLPQESINQSVMRLVEFRELPKDCRTAIGAPFTFVAGAQFVFAPLCYGHTAYITPMDAMRDPVLLADYIEKNQINLTFISPKILKIFKPKGSSLKFVHTGSERVSGIFIDQFRIIVGYGQTESAGGVLFFEVDKKYDNTPIGKSFGGAKAYILDKNNCEANEGELCLAGIFADCYLNLPELSAATFTENPFRECDGFEKLLHTGDIVKKGEDGNIIYLNRRDWMVKINGQRVEPGEIEAVIKNISGIADAAVKDFKNNYGQVYLVAYYTEKETVDAQELKAAVAEQLPSYMIPAFFVRLDKLPVNQNGKLDRNALTAPEASEFKNEYAAPETDLQKALCAAFETILEAENIGIDDDFFALGGDSIKSVMVARECEAYHVSAADIPAGKTPRGIERIINQKTGKAVVAKKENNPKVYPLTSPERGMYLE
ncbi:MAG: non-ribosomal peptide synthetase, partial [Ruminococcus sp.]|nr:non-ribosomal peptide synthetase [Ruminococcus sp.]